MSDEQGGGDAAYDLCGDYTPEEFCAELLKTLKAGWGLTNAQGAVTLSIHITKPGSKP